MRPIIAHHLVWSTYGFWLPNDQRGSGSSEVRAPHLKPYGPATKVHTSASVAHRPFDPTLREAARSTLKYPHVRLDGRQARAVARGIATDAASIDLGVYAVAIMPDHVHLVTVRHATISGRDLLTRLKAAASRRLTSEAIHPLSTFEDSNGRKPTPWGTHGWDRFLHTPKEVVSRIR